MRERARKLCHLVILGLGLALAIPEAAAAAPRRNERSDHCVVFVWDGVPSSQTLVFRDVPTLNAGVATPLHGLYFSSNRVPLPLFGSAVVASDGMVRIGIKVYSSARRPTITGTDFHLSGETDASFAGVVHFKVDGEYTPNELRVLEPVDCATIDIP